MSDKKELDPNVVYKFLGSAGSLPDIPMRDLTQEDLDLMSPYGRQCVKGHPEIFQLVVAAQPATDTTAPAAEETANTRSKSSSTKSTKKNTTKGGN